MNWLASDLINAVSAGLTLIAVIVALILGISSIRETRNVQKREFRHRLLKEIADWAMELQRTELEFNIPLVTNPNINNIESTVEGNTLLRYGSLFGKNEYVKAIAQGAFKEELLPTIEETIRIFTAYLYLRSTVFGMSLEESFKGTAIHIIEEVKAELADNHKSMNDLKDEYARRLAGSATKLQIITGNVLASLHNS